MIELVIFDLDGTLVDSAEDIRDALNFAIEETGLPPLGRDETVALIGEGVTRLMEKVLGPGLKHRKDELLAKFLDHYSRNVVRHTKAYPDVENTLRRLRVRKKAVISNKREALSREILDRLGLLRFFDAVLGSDSLGEKKPSPVPVLHLLARFSIQPENAVIVGDSDIDIQTGIASGIHTIGVTYGYRSPESLDRAEFLINDMTELEYILEKLV